MGKEWTIREVRALMRTYPYGGLKSARKRLPGRTDRAIEGKAQRERAASRARRGVWTPEQEQRLYDMRADGLTYAACAEALGRSVPAVQQRMRSIIERRRWRYGEE